MAISSGTKVGPYEVIAPLGAGGMGEVYRARDLRLSREVALKTLLPEAASDAGRRERFEQEGRAIAALNHPNIIGIYDVGAWNDVTYLVSELIDGESLADLLRRGPLTTRKMLDIAVQVADGLAAAHAAGIVHRDLKPDNIMITRDGRAKILDFGLARQSALKPAASDRTETVQITEPGMILGTVNYMSPEQAAGRAVDSRSDQFSFGIILYEMASGKRPFERKESVQTLAAILSDPAPPIEAPLPEPLRWIIDRCLAKEPEERYESTRDLYQELRNVRNHWTDTSARLPAPARVPRKARRLPLWTAIASAMVLAYVAGALLSPAPQARLSSYRFTPFAVAPSGQRDPVWSPDGKGIAYTGWVDGRPQVFVRYLDSPTAVRITHIAEGGRPIAWSPDARRIYLLSFGSPMGVWSVAAVGGEPEPVLPLPDEAYGAVWQAVDVAPNSSAIAALRSGPDGRVSLYISAPPGAPLKPYLPAPFSTRMLHNMPRIRFSPDSSKLLLYINRGNGEEAWLMPYPADPANAPRRTLQNVPTLAGTPEFSWMPDNRRILLSTKDVQDTPVHLWMADTASRALMELTAGNSNEVNPAVSPDGHTIAYTAGTSDYDVVSVSIQNAELQKLVATDRNEMMPAWAANQPRLVYVTDRNGPIEIWIHNPDGDRPLVTAADFPNGPTQFFLGPALSPEGDRVVYQQGDGHRSWLWMSAVSGGLPVRLSNFDKGEEYAPAWSPDGNWCAFNYTREGKTSLLKVKTTGQAAPIELSASVPWAIPAWSPANDWIAYLASEHSWNLISPNGKTVRKLGDLNTPSLVFSKDGRRLFGLREETKDVILFAVDVNTGAVKDIGHVGADARPRSAYNPGIRFSLAPDGESFVFSTVRTSSNLWLFRGFYNKPGVLERLGLGRQGSLY